MTDTPLTRRQFLAGAGVLAGGAVLARSPTRSAVPVVSDDDGPAPRAHPLRPLLGGTWLTAAGTDGWGTLGVGVDDGGDAAVVTARHVVDHGSDETPGEIIGRDVFQPSAENGAIGTVAAASEIGGVGSSDWAVIHAGVERTPRTVGLGAVDDPTDPVVGQRVVLDGAYTGLVGGEVTRVGVSANFRGELYTDMIEYRVDQDVDTDGNSGGVVAVIDGGEVRPVGLHAFAVDEWRYAIDWGDLPANVSVPASGPAPDPPAVAGVLEGVLYGRDGGALVRVRNVGGDVVEGVAALLDPDTGATLDSLAVEIGPLDHRDLVLDPGGRETVVLEVGRTRVTVELPPL